MAEISEFEKLRQMRLRYVESARENNFEEGLKSLLSELYPDNAHFIYELLQNAEDARATIVEFSLREDSLKVVHDGQRLFTITDIESITGIGKSTKKDDPTQIGKFGVGFKAVFAYTTRPEIRSGIYTFALEDLFVPAEIPNVAPSDKTTFTFPFNRPEKPVAVAREEVERGLTELSENTLLFLNHIQTITYELPDGRVGFIERKEIDDLTVSIQKSEGEDFVESWWLRLTGPVSIRHAENSSLNVAVAFRMEDSKPPEQKLAERSRAENLAQTPQRKIVPLDDGQVSIYFPAVKESSGLRFHIHAPFASTVARDSVRDDPGNIRLIEDIAKLLVDTLPQLRTKRLLNDSFLEALPNQKDAIGSPYDLIRKALTEAFNDQDLTPARGTDGGFAPARTLVSGPSEFRNLLELETLPGLLELSGANFDRPPRWIRERDGRAGAFLSGLSTIKFGWEELKRVMYAASSADEILEDADVYDEDDQTIATTWFSLLDSMVDETLLKFYQLVGLGSKQRKFGFQFNLSAVPIVRLRKGGRSVHVRGSRTHLPSDRNDMASSRVPIELAYFDSDEDQERTSNLESFYQASCTKRWDESARIEQRIAEYKQADRPVPQGFAIQRHLEDVRSFLRYASLQEESDALDNVKFLLADGQDGSQIWVTAQETFVDSPFLDTGLSALYCKNTEQKHSNQRMYPLAGAYLGIEGIIDFVSQLGAKTRVEIVNANVFSNTSFEWRWRYENRENWRGSNTDWEIEHLDRVLETPNSDLLRELWNTVVEAPASRALAFYQANGSSSEHRIESQLAQSLRSTPWILTGEGELKLPREVQEDDLPGGWQVPEPNSLVYKLGFGADAARRRQKREGVADFLREEGFDDDTFELMREAKELGLDLRVIIREHHAMVPAFHGASEDPDRRAEIARQGAFSAPRHTTSIRSRSTVDGQTQASQESKEYLRHQYTNALDEMHCQACRKPMPFKTKNGSWYFEAITLVTSRKYVHSANNIALCPLCAALYKHARATKDEDILDQLHNISVESNQGSTTVNVVLNSKHVQIGFTGKHAIDIKAALEVAGDERETGGA